MTHETQLIEEWFWNKVDRRGRYECWPWLSGKNPDGYGWVRIGSRPYTAHRIAFSFYWGIDLPPSWLCVLHDCPNGDNRDCCNPEHLWLGTNADNSADRDTKGRQARGERHGVHTIPENRSRGSRHGSAKLNEEQVEYIRSRYAAGGILMKDLAKLFNIDRSQIGKIIHRIYWK